MSDAVLNNLLQQAIAGDRESLHVLIALALPSLSRWVQRAWANDSEYAAEEIVQDTILSVWRSFGTLRATSYPGFRAWMQEIARNLIRNAVRTRNTRRRRHDRQDVDDRGWMLVEYFARHTRSPRSALANRELMELVRAAIEALPDLQRNIVRWRLLDEDSFETIAGRTGKSVGAVKMQLTRALSLLRTVMGSFHHPTTLHRRLQWMSPPRQPRPR